jgi:hypothetical protein
LPQNLKPSGFCVPQFGQVITARMVLRPLCPSGAFDAPT